MMHDVWGGKPESTGWGPVGPGVGRRIRAQGRSFGTASMQSWLSKIGLRMHGAGEVIVVADVSLPAGGSFPPHASHRDGRDVDLSYGSAVYPTPIGAPVSDTLVVALAETAAAIEQVYVSNGRKQEIEARAKALGVEVPELVVWPGHAMHIHVRLEKDNVV